jgi:tetratricopeptide (TPR) repeat protein
MRGLIVRQVEAAAPVDCATAALKPAIVLVGYRRKLSAFAVSAGCHLAKDWLRCVLLFLFAVAVHLPALQGQRIWDDGFLSLSNPFIKSPLLIAEVFRHPLWVDGFSGHYRPLQNVSFMVDYLLWNTDATGFHLTNILLHSAAGVLLYFLLKRLLARLCPRQSSAKLSLGAFLVALLWVIHPVHSAAVDYISGRADSLAFAFATGGWLLFLRARETGGGRRICLFLGAAVAGLLALCSRETGCIWFVMFLLFELVAASHHGIRSKLALVGVCCVILAAYAGLRKLPERRDGPAPSHASTMPLRATLMFRALGDYGRLMVYPSNLHMERTVFFPEAERSNAGWRNTPGGDYLAITGLVVLGAFAFGCVRRGEGRAARIAGAICFFAGYLPISNIVELNATVAEHWLYFPSIGFLLFLAGCVMDFPRRFQRGAVAFACLAVVALSARSAVRSSDWADEETFYKRTLAAGGVSTRLLVNLASVYAQRGDYAASEKLFHRVLQITPDYPSAQNSLAEVLRREGRESEAQEILRASSDAAAKMRAEYPRTWAAAHKLARMQHFNGDDAAALATLEKADSDYPGTWELISFHSELLRLNHQPDAALRLVEDFAGRNWWHFGAALALGRLYAELGAVDQADAALWHASRLDVHDAEALDLIAAIRTRQNRLHEAYDAQRRAVRRQPDEPRQHLMLAEILMKMGREEEAHASTARARQLAAVAGPVASID